MPEGNDKPKSLQELTGIPGNTIFGQPESTDAQLLADPTNKGGLAAKARTRPARSEGPAPVFPMATYQAPQQETFRQATNAALRYEGALEQEARSYYGDLGVSQADIDAYKQMRHRQITVRQRQAENAAAQKFLKDYADPQFRNTIVGIDKYKGFIEQQRNASGGQNAPVKLDDVLDENNNVSQDFIKRLYDATGGNQAKMRLAFADVMRGKSVEYNQPGRQSSNQQDMQDLMDNLHSNAITLPSYYVMRAANGLFGGLASTGNLIVNGLGGSLAEGSQRLLGVDPTVNAAELYTNAQKDINRTYAPNTTARDESQNWYNLDHIISSGAHMTGEFAPSLFLGGNGSSLLPKVEQALTRYGLQGGMTGAAARFGARAIGDSFTGRLLQNSAHMMKTAFPQVYSGYVEDGMAKGYTPEQATARAIPRAIINTLALSVPGAVSRAGVSMNAVPERILGTATEQSRMQALLGTAGQFVKAPLTGGSAFAAGSLADSWQDYMEDRKEGRDGVTEDAGFIDYMNWQQGLKEGALQPGTTFDEYKQLPEAQQFGYGHAFKNMAEQGMFGVMWGMIEKVGHGHGVLPNPVQADYIRMATNNPAEFNDAVDRSVRRGRLTQERGEAMKAFVEQVAPTVAEGEQSGLGHREAVQYAVEAERLKETAREIEALTNQGQMGEAVDANGKKVPVLLGRNPNTGQFDEATGAQLTAQIQDLQTRASQSAYTIQQLKEKTYLKGRTVSGDEMMRMSARFSPADGLREGQAARIVENGPYRTEVINLDRYAQDPEIQDLASRLLLGQDNPELGGDLAGFNPTNTNPVVLDAQGGILDGKKRIAYAIANGATELEVARPLKLAELAARVKDEVQQAPDAPVATDGLAAEQVPVLEKARAIFDKELSIDRTPTQAEREAGVTNKETRAYYAAAMELHDQGLSRTEAVDMLRRMTGGNISTPMAEAFYNDIAARKAGEQPLPVHPGMVPAPVASETAAAQPTATGAPKGGEADYDENLARSPFWDKATAQLAPEFQPGSERFDEVLDWLEANEAATEAPAPVQAAAPAVDPVQSINARREAEIDQMIRGSQTYRGYEAALNEIQADPQATAEDIQRSREKVQRTYDDLRKNHHLLDTVNAKYDAEIAALRDAPTEMPAQPREGFTPIAEISNDYNRFHGNESLNEDWIGREGMAAEAGKFDQPVTLWRDPADGKLYVLDGKNRLEAARRMGWDAVNADIRTDLDEAGARRYAESTRLAEGRTVLSGAPVRYVTSDGKYAVTHDGTRLNVKNLITGKDAVAKQRAAAIREAAAKYQFNAGLQLDPRGITEATTAADYGFLALEQSDNPAEIARAWSVQEPELSTDWSGPYDEQIAQFVGPIFTGSTDFQRGELGRLLDGDVATKVNWLTKDPQKGSTLSDIAQQVNDSMGQADRVTPDDVLNFMLAHPGGVRGLNFEATRDSPLAQDLARRFETMTGFPLTEQIAAIATKQDRAGLTPGEQHIFDQEIQSNEELERLYDEAVASGDIIPGAENVPDPADASQAPRQGAEPAGVPGPTEQSREDQDGFAARRFGRVSILASKEILEQSGWTQKGKGGTDALLSKMRNMFGRDISLMVTDNAHAESYWAERGQTFEDPSLTPNAWVSADLKSIYLNVEKCPPSALLDELGHVWSGWARQHAPEIHAEGMRLAEQSAEWQYMDGYLAGESPVAPEGMSEAEADLWQRYAEAYGRRADGKSLLLEEVVTHAIQKQGKLLSPAKDQARTVAADGTVKKGTWGKWLDSLWEAVKGAAGFRKMTNREFSKITLEEFSRAAAEEIAQGKALTRKIKEALDADVKTRDIRRKDARKGEEIDESLQEQVETAGRKPKIATSEEGETSSIESTPSAQGMAIMSAISPSDLLDRIDVVEPSLAQRLREAVRNTSLYEETANAPSEDIRVESALLDIISDPQMLTSKRDVEAIGGLVLSRRGQTRPEFTGLIGEFYEKIAGIIEKAAPEAGITAESLANEMSNRAKKAEADSDIKRIPRDRKPYRMPAAAKETPAPRPPKPMSEARSAKLKELDDLFALPEQLGEGDERFSLPQADPQLEARRFSAAINFVESSIGEGSVSLRDILTDVYDQLGAKLDNLFPYIRKAYLAHAAEAPEEVVSMMDDTKTVRAFDYAAFKNELNVSSTEPGLEPDSTRTGAADAMGGADVQPANGSEAERGAGPRGQEAELPQSGSEPAGRDIVPADVAAAGGERGNRPLSERESGDGQLPAGTTRGYDRGRSGWFGNPGQGPAGGRTSPAPRFAEPGARGVNPEKLQAQIAAEALPIEIGNKQNVAETLPYLLPSQHEDVTRIEKRLAKDNGYGMLIANGTGTGKTFTALGAIKRMVASGKTEGIILVPGDAVMEEWLASAPALGIDIQPLKDTKSMGSGVSITTYANFGKNNELVKRNLDWVVADEAHRLMRSGDAADTRALDGLRAVTLHPDGIRERVVRLHPELFAELEAIRSRQLDSAGLPTTPQGHADEARSEQILQQINALKAAERRMVTGNQGAARPRLLAMSATPFAYRENIQWAEGYLFEYPKVEDRGIRGVPNPYEQFMIDHFGYRMRPNGLSAPDANVDTSYMEREFNEWLSREGALSTRPMDAESDYERKFALTPNAIGTKIDEGLEFLREGQDGYFRPLYDLANRRFDFIRRQRLLEALKAEEAVPIIKQLIKQGKKVLVYHDYIEGGGFSPFRFDDLNPSESIGVRTPNGTRAMPLGDLVKQFYAQRPDLADMDFDKLKSPIETLVSQFPDAGIVNGKNKKTRTQAIRDFNDDLKSSKNLLIVQSDIAEGFSAHDKTGKFPRVLINLGQPSAPTKSIQQEGRVYRTGQAKESNSLFLYMNTGTNWERFTFASTIAQRAETAENLAMGNRARGLKRSFIEAFNDSAPYTPSPEDGKGTRDSDRRMMEGKPFDVAKSLYYAQQKRNSRTKSQEGVDYFATPEPLGFKMVEWAAPRPGEDWLEPSAGHGAIARFLPDNTRRTLIEPSLELSTRAMMNAPGAKMIRGQFEDLHIVNKYDGIVMNPPFGVAGKVASEHVEKATQHLRPGGRVVATVPVGAFNDKFDKWFSGTDAKGKPLNGDLNLTARILLPSSAFGRAGTNVNTQILIIDKAPAEGQRAVNPTQTIDLRDAKDVNELFDAIENLQVTGRPEVIGEVRHPVNTDMPALAGDAPAPTDKLKPVVQAKHTKTQADIWVVPTNGRMADEEYKSIASIAKSKYDGYYSSFRGNGAIPGFIFKSAEKAEAFRQEIAAQQPVAEAAGERFSLPMREAVDDIRKDTDIDNTQAIADKMEALAVEGQQDPEALAARGELFSLPLSLKGRVKQIKDAHQRYFVKEDAWLGNRELARVEAEVDARRYQEQIQKSVGEKPGGLKFRERAEWKKNWRNVDKAIHIYMDTLRNPAHVALYDKALADAKLTVKDPAATPLEVQRAHNIIKQEEVVKLSQNLTAEQKRIADDILRQYDKIGQMAISGGVIRDVVDGYVARAWDFGAFATEERNRFTTSTRHSMQRTLDTILEGFSRGYTLKVEGASNNLGTLYREISNVIENNRLLEEGLSMKDDNGDPLFSTQSGREGYARIDNKSFRKWTYAGKLSDYTAADRRLFNRDTLIAPNGSVMRKVDVYAPKEVATSLNNILGQSKIDAQGLTKFNAAVKQSILSSSLFHYIAFTRAHVLGHANWWSDPKSINPKTAYKAGLNLIAEKNPMLQEVVKAGMSLGRRADWEEGIRNHSSKLGAKIDAMGGFPAAAKKALLDWNHEFHKHLFDTYGAGLKAFDAIATMKNELARNTGESRQEIAERVAKIMNDSYGGVNWNRHFRGSKFQDPTVRHLSSLLLLAPDWTTSNLRLFRNAFRAGETGLMYRKMWGKVMLRGIMLTAFANAAMAAWDDDEEDANLSVFEKMSKRYGKGWDAGRLRWAMIDITPLYHAMGGDETKRSYFSVFGAYTDPIRMLGVKKEKDGGYSYNPTEFFEHKASFIGRATLEAFTGENWQHKQFTTLDELCGIDDKGTYAYDQGAHTKGEINPDTGEPYKRTAKGHAAGDAKGGKNKGELTRYPDYGGGKTVLRNLFSSESTLPSFVLSQLRGMLPTQLQSLSAAATGENDWAQFMLQAPGTGIVQSKDPDAQ